MSTAFLTVTILRNSQKNYNGIKAIFNMFTLLRKVLKKAVISGFFNGRNF